jgi:single-stranded DNA-binding protein
MCLLCAYHRSVTYFLCGCHREGVSVPAAYLEGELETRKWKTTRATTSRRLKSFSAHIAANLTMLDSKPEASPAPEASRPAQKRGSSERPQTSDLKRLRRCSGRHGDKSRESAIAAPVFLLWRRTQCPHPFQHDFLVTTIMQTGDDNTVAVGNV